MKVHIVLFFYIFSVFFVKKKKKCQFGGWIRKEPEERDATRSPKSNRRSKQSHSWAWEVCSSWLFWASLCSSRLVSHYWPQRCLESLMRGGEGGPQSASSLWQPAIRLPAWHIAANEFAETVLQRVLTPLSLYLFVSSARDLHLSLVVGPRCSPENRLT